MNNPITFLSGGCISQIMRYNISTQHKRVLKARKDEHKWKKCSLKQSPPDFWT